MEEYLKFLTTCREPNVGLDLPMHGQKLIHLVSQSLSRNVLLHTKAETEKVGRSGFIYALGRGSLEVRITNVMDFTFFQEPGLWCL